MLLMNPIQRGGHVYQVGNGGGSCFTFFTPCAVATSDCSFSAGMPLPLSEMESRYLGKSNLISTEVAPASMLFEMTSFENIYYQQQARNSDGMGRQSGQAVEHTLR